MQTLSTRTGLSPTLAGFSKPFRFLSLHYWPLPRSLATTDGVSIDVLSSGYLDVSVPRVRLITLCIQMMILQCRGFPHSDICGSTNARFSPQLFAACHVLLRLSVPRHPPYALTYSSNPHQRPADRPKATIRNQSPAGIQNTQRLRCKLIAATGLRSTHCPMSCPGAQTARRTITRR